jgi:hypothetical protein
MAETGQEQATRALSAAAQLLGETMIHAAGPVAKEHHAEGYRQLESWLEDLEQHTSSNITPFLMRLLESEALPDEFRVVIEEAVTTPAQFSAIVTQLFLYGIVSQVLSTSVQPFLQGVTNDLWTQAVSDGIAVPVSPAVLATAAARGLQFGAKPTITITEEMYAEAAKSGVSKADLDLQGSIVGTPPAPQELFELERRGIINTDDVARGLAEGDTRDDWIPQLQKLAHGWLTPVDFIRAAVQNQMTYQDAAAWAKKTGLDTDTQLPLLTGASELTPDMFGLGVAIAGRPPGPVELANMALRGIIPQNGTGADATTFQQGIAESDVKTKWTDYLWQLAQYLPPPGEIATLLERGGITNEQAVTLWKKRGVPDEIATAYAYVTEQQHVTQDKLLAKGVITTAYYDQLLSRADALDMLGQLGYHGTVADTMLAVQDFRREMTALNAVVRRITTLFGQNKLSATDAKAALVQVGVPAAEADEILQYWAVLREQPVRLPTGSEIGLALKYGTIDQETGLDELQALGYQPRDAAIVLSAHAGVQIKPLPPAGTGVTG